MMCSEDRKEKSLILCGNLFVENQGHGYKIGNIKY